MLAHFNNSQKKITVISIPRDLFFNGRKINSVYTLYGMEEFKRQLSILTGVQIDKYILIDMYAFIDVIDLIGGVDIYLEEAVIDPSYKTYDNGEWGTLYYKAGYHHLNGKQSLRLARSRHYSSDFARAERQQKILQSIKQKAQNMGLGGANTLLNIGETILSKTETDIALPEAVSFYFRYQDFLFESGGVLSTGNVLISAYEGEINNPTLECFAEDCEVRRGAYILLPQDNNWDLIKWFVIEKLKPAVNN